VSKFCEAFGRSEHVLPLSSALAAHSMIGKHGSIFGIGQHGGILPSLCDKRLHNKHLDHIDSPWHDGCYLNYRVPLTKFMKTASIPPPAPICMSAFRSDTILPCRAAPVLFFARLSPNRSAAGAQAHGVFRIGCASPRLECPTRSAGKSDGTGDRKNSSEFLKLGPRNPFVHGNCRTNQDQLTSI
jgi:hypothetical protein